MGCWVPKQSISLGSGGHLAPSPLLQRLRGTRCLSIPLALAMGGKWHAAFSYKDQGSYYSYYLTSTGVWMLLIPQILREIQLYVRYIIPQMTCLGKALYLACIPHSPLAQLFCGLVRIWLFVQCLGIKRGRVTLIISLVDFGLKNVDK